MVEYMMVEHVTIPPERQLQEHPNQEQLVNSILQLGLQQPIVVTEDGTLVDGLGRLKAYRELKWTCVPVRVISEKEAKSYRLMTSHASRARL